MEDGIALQVIGALGVVEEGAGDGKHHTKRAPSKAVRPRVLNIRIECGGPELVPCMRAHVLVQKPSAAIEGPLHHLALGRRACLRRDLAHAIKRVRFVFEKTNVVHIGPLVNHRKHIAAVKADTNRVTVVTLTPTAQPESTSVTSTPTVIDCVPCDGTDDSARKLLMGDMPCCS